ncbi:DUF6745 domain-containing protein [Gordonia araii]|uniref:DUF6745 domain-containing protein n=1 Tax=Gordonia araii TaxID=263909 RepID=UPI0011103177|nr:hypothetical protein [Gordonia araii]NNG97442.1 hypothetical protein [Gordonia araii NBRC 100433]
MASWYCSELSAWWDRVWLARLICETTFAGISDTSRLTAVAALTAAVGCWWPMDGAVVVVERPTVIRCDAMGCVHGEDGPALIFADGYAVYAWHGTAVPADMIHAESWSVARILAERNLEVRRCAAEHMGWGEFLTRAGAQLVAEAPDPGNAPHRLELYDLPDEILEAYPRDVRVCLCTNGSLERDGSARRYGIVVRADLDDPVEAIADSYGVSAEVYRGLQARR